MGGAMSLHMKRIAVPVLAACAAWLVPQEAAAVYSCGGQNDDCQCNKDNPFPCCSDSAHGTNHGNCTWWAWEAACCNWGAPALPTYGNAWHWKTEAIAAGWPMSDQPVVGSVFVRTVGGGWCANDNHDCGHVGWVTSVDGNGGFCSTEQACYGWYGVKTYCHPPGYADGGFICKKGTTCGPPQPSCTTEVGSSGETVIDDTNPCFQRHGTASYWWEASLGYGGHMWWTYATDDAVDDYGVWTLQVKTAGNYEVFAYIPENNATSQKARYQIRHNGQDSYATVNQNDIFAQFTSLGTYDFSAGGDQYVRLNDSTGEDYNTYKRKLGFDAVKLVPKASCTPNASKSCSGGDLYWYDSCGNQGNKAEECDDGNPCTDDGCSGSACTHSNNGASCSDGNPCTVGDHCSGGSCSGTQMDCSWASDACNDAACESGTCVKHPKAGNCDDGDPCTHDDVCAGGVCQGTALDCSALADACNDAGCSGGVCTTFPHDGPCDDANACTAGDACVQGVCKGAPVDCDDLDPCTTDSCDPQHGCLHSAVPECCNDDGDCDDGEACTVDVCLATTCVSTPSSPHAAKTCKDGDVFWLDSCGALGDLAQECGECGCTAGECGEADCTGRECGPDGCGGSCGECQAGWTCEPGREEGTTECVPCADCGAPESAGDQAARDSASVEDHAGVEPDEGIAADLSPEPAPDVTSDLGQPGLDTEAPDTGSPFDVPAFDLADQAVQADAHAYPPEVSGEGSVTGPASSGGCGAGPAPPSGASMLLLLLSTAWAYLRVRRR